MVLPVPLSDIVKEEGRVKVESVLLGVAKGEDGVPGPFDLGLGEVCDETFAAFPPLAGQSRTMSRREAPLSPPSGGLCRACAYVGGGTLAASPVYMLLPV